MTVPSTYQYEITLPDEPYVACAKLEVRLRGSLSGSRPCVDLTVSPLSKGLGGEKASPTTEEVQAAVSLLAAQLRGVADCLDRISPDMIGYPKGTT